MQSLGGLIFVVLSVIAVSASEVSSYRRRLSPSLSVVVSAGQPRDKVSRVREIAVFVHGLNSSQVDEAILEVFENENDTTPLKRIPLRDNIAERYEDSIRVFTGLTFKPTSWAPNNFPQGDIGYFSRVSIGGSVIANGSLRVQPRWMERLMPSIGKLTLFQLAIPGTHDSGTYKLFKRQNIVNRYRDCQEEDIFTQLLYGVRSLDLRPAAVKKSSSPYNGFEYWIYHDVVPTKNRLDTILTDIRRFLDIFQDEVVFVDFHEYPVGFNSREAFEGLAKLVNDTLGRHLFPSGNLNPMHERLDSVVRSQHRAIVTYDKDKQLRTEYFPGVRHIWANTDQIDKLQDFIKTRQLEWRREAYWFFNGMSEITPQGAWNVIIDKYRGGVRGIAHRDNFQISGWYRYDPVMRDNANLISFDYIASSDIVDLCKDINLERARIW